MNIATAVSSYISHKRAQGMRFIAEDAILKAFCKAVDDIPLADVQATAVLAFLDGRGPVTETWAKKYHVLSGFYRFALAMLVQLIAYMAKQLHKSIDRLAVVDLSATSVRAFLLHLEQERHCTTGTRNQRLGGLHALARFIGENSPEHLV